MSGIDMEAQMGPDYMILLDDEDITGNFRSRLISLLIDDKRGMEADVLTLELDDSDGKIALPPHGSVLHVYIGWQGGALFDKGTFVLTTINHNGAPDRLTLSGFSADVGDSLKQSRSDSWHNATLGEIVDEIAQRNHLKAALSPDIAAIAIGHIDQTNESDLQFIARLADKYGTVPAIKFGRLMLIIAGNGTSASGRALPKQTITRQQGDKHQFEYKADSVYSGTRARWMQLDKARSGQVTVSADPAFSAGLTAAARPRYLMLPRLYSSRDEAVHDAQAQWKKNQRASVTLTFGLAMGRPDVIPETQVAVTGFKPAIDKQKWVVSNIKHTIDTNGGFTSSVALEAVPPQGVIITEED